MWVKNTLRQVPVAKFCRPEFGVRYLCTAHTLTRHSGLTTRSAAAVERFADVCGVTAK